MGESTLMGWCELDIGVGFVHDTTYLSWSHSVFDFVPGDVRKWAPYCTLTQYIH